MLKLGLKKLNIKFFFFLLIITLPITWFIIFNNFNMIISNRSFYLTSNCSCRNNEIINVKEIKNGIFQISSSLNINFNYQITSDEFKISQFTCDPYHTFKRGKNLKVIAMSLYGKNTRYTRRLIKTIRQIAQMYPGWLLRIYHDNSINEKIKCELECLKNEEEKLIDNTDFCDINNIYVKGSYSIFKNKSLLNTNNIHAMKWRWFPIGDSFVDMFSSRDSDSFFLQREIDSVNVWIKSNKVGHIMRG
jgi:hypothetical protein